MNIFLLNGNCWIFLPGCNFCTYFLEDDLHLGSCYLLTSLLGPLEDCPNCKTGPVNCDDEKCGLISNGQKESYMMFTHPGVISEFNTSLSVRLTSCQLRVMVIGGGGRANWDGDGSGYIQYLSKTITSSPQIMIKLIVGNKRLESKVTMDGYKISALVLAVQNLFFELKQLSFKTFSKQTEQ